MVWEVRSGRETRVRPVSGRSAVSSLRQRMTPRLLAFGAILRYLSAVSLSTFVERKDVKEYLRLNVAKPWFQVRAEIKAPPLTTSYGWTGTAFDYAMRFYLQKLNPCAKVRRWLAEESAALVVASRRETARTKKRVLGIVETAKDCVRSYLKCKRDAKPGRELIRAAVDLAQLDLVYRIGLLDLRPINDAMVEDIGNMLALVRPDDFRAKRTCVLNPTFGAASELVGGADGDLFIDGTLVDIKVNKHLELGAMFSTKSSATSVSPASAESMAVVERSRASPCTSRATASFTDCRSSPSWKPTACPRISNGSKQQRIEASAACDRLWVRFAMLPRTATRMLTIDSIGYF